MYTPRTSVEAIPNASIHHSALQNRDFGHTYDRSRALVRALGNVLVPVFGLKTRQKTRQNTLIGISIVNRYRYSSIGNPHTSRFAIVSRF
jgi:hypothetical protein